MSKNTYYDLLVLLDSETPEGRREQIVDAVKKQIKSGSGSLKGDADWGMRRLAYEIEHRTEAQYHLFQLEAEPELLKELDRTLSIEDGVLRHRIIRLSGEPSGETPRPAPSSSPPPEQAAASSTQAEPSGDDSDN